jgi:hypothetical protein
VRLDTHEHRNRQGFEVAAKPPGPNNAQHDEGGTMPHPATRGLTESVKPRELSAADREAQIVALWRGRPPARRGPDQVAEFVQWLSDYTPWLVPPGAQPLDEITAIVRPHMNGG